MRKEREGVRASWECPGCGSDDVRLVESFAPEPGGRFMCNICGYRWVEG